MLTRDGLVNLLNVIAPLYICVALGYISIKWRIISYAEFHPGISGFTSKFALPFLCFRLLATNNPYRMNIRLLLADTLFKCATLLFGALACFSRKSYDYVAWISLLFNLTTLPNSVLIGIPLLTALYPGTQSNITTLIFMQIAIWFVVCIVLLEIHKALYENSADYAAARMVEKQEIVLVEREPNANRDCANPDDQRGGGATPMPTLPLVGTEHDGVFVVTVDHYQQQQEQGDSNPSLVIMAKNSTHDHEQHQQQGQSVDEASVSPTTNSSSNEEESAMRKATISSRSPLAPEPTNTSQGSKSSHHATVSIDVVEGRSSGLSATGGTADSGRGMRMKARPSKFRIAATVAKAVIYEVIRSPSLCGSFSGLVYSLISFKLNEGEPLPEILKTVVAMIGDSTLGLAMFMLGMSIANSKKLFTCGVPMALMGAGIRFIIAPAAMAVCSVAVGLRGDTFRFAVTQSMVPQAVISFVLATQYNVHIDIFSTAVWFQTLIFLPFAIALEALLSLNS